jgi:leucyl-tRNA synthetase
VGQPLAGTAPAGTLKGADLKLRRNAHKAVASVTDDIEGFRFNRAVARIYELANQIAGAAGSAEKGPDYGPVMREALEFIVQLVGPMMPHFAEEAWEKLGHTTLLIDSPWPEADLALIVDDEVTMAIQVNGKRRGEITCPAGSDPKEVEALALGVDTVIKAMDGKPARKVIVVPDRIINVVI